MKNISGTVHNAELCEPIGEVLITVRDDNGKILQKVKSDQNGNWQIQELDEEEIVCFQKPGFGLKQYEAKNIPSKVRLLEDYLIGYQKKLWFLPDEEVEVFVNSTENYIARLYRHGEKKELVRQLGEFPSCQQQVPDGNFVDEGLDWVKSFTYQIPSDAKLGIYSLLLTSKKDVEFAIPFVVSTSPSEYGKKSKILVLLSTNSWQSYNTWGGRSRYRNFEDVISEDFLGSAENKNSLRKKIKKFIPSFIIKFIRGIRTKLSSESPGLIDKSAKGPDFEWIHKKLSIRRPFINCRLEENNLYHPFINHLAAGEWRLLAWLEREGYEYDIVAGYDLHNNPSLLNNYRGIVLNTHSEYWSKKMYDGLVNFHEQNKGWVLNISGNSIYREVDFYDDGSLRCVSLMFAESCADETQIIGVRITSEDYSTCAPYKILKPDHWAFNGIPISKSQIFGSLSLNKNISPRTKRYDSGRPGVAAGLDGCGASGWETDKLSKTAPSDIVLIAKGCNEKGGADMVIREPSGKRGGMFSASSILFSGALLIDTVASMLVKNVLDRVLKE